MEAIRATYPNIRPEHVHVWTLGGPSRTTNVHGIANADWYVTIFGDGFKTQIDPENPDIVYSQWQYGHLVRFDRKSGETLDIQPQPAADDGVFALPTTPAATTGVNA